MANNNLCMLFYTYMHIANVLPIVKSPISETLSYFSAKPVKKGDLVLVPLRKKSIYGIVTDVEDVVEQKARLRSAHFNLRKIEKVIGPSPLNESVIESALNIKDFYATSASLILESVIPETILGSFNKIQPSQPSIKKELKTDIKIFQTNEEERISFWKTHIREVFAQKKHVFIILPTIHLINEYQGLFERGIKEYVRTYSSKKRPKEIISLWDEIRTSDHPLLVIGTPQLISFFDERVGSIIVEYEHHNAYTLKERPFIDMRDFIELVSKNSGCPMIYGDQFIRTETIARYDNKELGSVRTPSFRFPNLSFIKTESLNSEDGSWDFFSLTLKKAIAKLEEKKEHLVIYVTRKGFAPVTECKDCKRVVSCSNCGAPLVLYKKGNTRSYSCNRCGNNEDSDRRCDNCDSWNLVPLGIGTETIQEEIKNRWKHIPVFVLDKHTTKKELEAEELILEFEKHKFGILIITDYGIPFLKGKYDKIAIASIDTMFAIPNFRMNEYILSKIIHLQELSNSPLLIQTSNQKEGLIEMINRGHLGTWHKEELSDRQALHYPPYGIIISVYKKGSDSEVKKWKQVFSEMFEKYNPYISTRFLNKEKKQLILTVILKTELSKWPNKYSPGKTKLSELIESLPPDVITIINPESIIW